MRVEWLGNYPIITTSYDEIDRATALASEFETTPDVTDAFKGST